MSQDEGGLVTTTVKDYDLQETAKAMKGLFTVSHFGQLATPCTCNCRELIQIIVTQGIAFMGFLHVYMKYTQPLFIQAIMTLKGVLE